MYCILPALPGTINRTYIDQASYWLTYFPCVESQLFHRHKAHPPHRLRGFLVLFDLAQIINLAWISFKKQYVKQLSVLPFSNKSSLAYLAVHRVKSVNGHSHQISSMQSTSEFV